MFWRIVSLGDYILHPDCICYVETLWNFSQLWSNVSDLWFVTRTFLEFEKDMQMQVAVHAKMRQVGGDFSNISKCLVAEDLDLGIIHWKGKPLVTPDPTYFSEK